MTTEDRLTKLDTLLSAYTNYFDIQRDVTAGDVTFAALAQYHSRSGKYILVKSAKIWSIEMNEYVYFAVVDHLDVNRLEALYKAARDAGLALIKPHSEHMRSYVSLAIIADSIDPEAQKALCKIRFRKSFWLALHGWMEFRIAAIDLSAGQVFSNPAGRDVRATLERNLQPK
ncbi:hypothetical protein ACS3UN_11105 [Oscillospiraceae bacterium LTW-04]|nr:hypothetical protein RBH76_12850 [Oscillospiraceae bacterium MB24-C1]